MEKKKGQKNMLKLDFSLFERHTRGWFENGMGCVWTVLYVPDILWSN